MNYRYSIWLLVSVIATCGVLAFEFGLPKGVAAPPAPPSSPPAPAAPPVPPNVNVVNTPGVTVVNVPTVRVQQHNWQYRTIVIPKVFPGTPEWNDFLGQLTNSGQEGWELVNIVENVAFLKKSS